MTWGFLFIIITILLSVDCYFLATSSVLCFVFSPMCPRYVCSINTGAVCDFMQLVDLSTAFLILLLLLYYYSGKFDDVIDRRKFTLSQQMSLHPLNTIGRQHNTRVGGTDSSGRNIYDSVS